ncbi:MAG TPA: carbohydrate ABC transporter permease [Actinomycetota bacterium]|nr:carbohydrate ABC transporter permease [Actinomycetota bacterium]
MSSVARTDVQLGQPVPVDFAPPPRPRRRLRFRPLRVLRYAVLTALAIIFVAPFAYMVTSAFQPLDQMFKYPPQWIPTNPTLENFTGFLTSDRPIGRWVFNSLFVTVTVTAAQLFFSSLVAYTFAKRTFPGRDFIFFLGLATMMLPAEVLLIPQYLILKSMPLFGGNDASGVGGHGMLDSYWGLILPHLMSPFGIFLLRQYMMSIPDQLIDAARIDGAGHFKIYWKIVLPLSKPALAALAIFTFQFFWEDLYGPLIIISSPELYTLPLGLALFVVQNRTLWHLVMAGSVLATIPVVILFFVFQKQFVRGISLSGMKG